jgi:hypothetical protein
MEPTVVKKFNNCLLFAEFHHTMPLLKKPYFCRYCSATTRTEHGLASYISQTSACNAAAKAELAKKAKQFMECQWQFLHSRSSILTSVFKSDIVKSDMNEPMDMEKQPQFFIDDDLAPTSNNIIVDDLDAHCDKRARVEDSDIRKHHFDP